MTKEKKYIEVNFYKLWKHVRINRTAKEKMKTFLFSTMPFLFNKFASCYHWKNARVFAGNPYVSDSLLSTLKKEKNNTPPNLAIVLHVYYNDVFAGILKQIPVDENLSIKLFITCPGEVKPDIEKTLLPYTFNHEIMVVENRGRDILPFLKVLPVAFNQGFNLILKLHTKRSNHLNKKEPWSSDLFNKLLGTNNVRNILNLFSVYPQIGMIGPAGNILPMALYYGGNALKVKELCFQMGLSENQLKNLNFVAGSMFYARKEVLKPVLKLGLSEKDFEPENKQLDNTMAHAVERIFPAGLMMNEMYLADTNSTPQSLSCKITLNHPFTL